MYNQATYNNRPSNNNNHNNNHGAYQRTNYNNGPRNNGNNYGNRQNIPNNQYNRPYNTNQQNQYNNNRNFNNSNNNNRNLNDQNQNYRRVNYIWADNSGNGRSYYHGRRSFSRDDDWNQTNHDLSLIHILSVQWYIKCTLIVFHCSSIIWNLYYNCICVLSLSFYISQLALNKAIRRTTCHEVATTVIIIIIIIIIITSGSTI